jgi:sec-independent protein translocase protein TatA
MIQGPQLIIVLAIVLLLFGGSKLPKLARSLGEAQKEFRDGLKESEEKDTVAPAANASTDTAPPAPASTNTPGTNTAGTNTAGTTTAGEQTASADNAAGTDAAPPTAD